MNKDFVLTQESALLLNTRKQTLFISISNITGLYRRNWWTISDGNMRILLPIKETQ